MTEFLKLRIGHGRLIVPVTQISNTTHLPFYGLYCFQGKLAFPTLNYCVVQAHDCWKFSHCHQRMFLQFSQTRTRTHLISSPHPCSVLSEPGPNRGPNWLKFSSQPPRHEGNVKHTNVGKSIASLQTSAKNQLKFARSVGLLREAASMRWPAPISSSGKIVWHICSPSQRLTVFPERTIFHHGRPSKEALRLLRLTG